MRCSELKVTIMMAAALALGGCLGSTEGEGNAVTRLLDAPGKSLGLVAETPDAKTGADTALAGGKPSLIISDLQSRRSILPDGSAYDRVAVAVLSSSARIAEAELRGARLRAQAAKHNWLPRIGPQVSLSSLGDFVASLIVEQVLFDNGRKTAERDYARHDVEHAAVALSEDSNTRVFEALSLYLAAEEGRARIAIADRSLSDMSHFEWVMNERVKGGVSDMSDLNIIRQKLAEIRADRDAALAEIRAAEAELAAMAGTPLSGLNGTPDMSVSGDGRVALAVLKAQAERDRAIAQARIARAQHLPGLSAGGSVTADGDSNFGLNIGSDQLFGLGTGASLKAIEAAKDAAARKVAKAREDSDRALAALDQKILGLEAQLAEADTLTAQAKANLDLFQAQYKGGARQVMDVVGVYETWARQSQSAVTKAHELSRLRLKKARMLGVLADGEKI